MRIFIHWWQGQRGGDPTRGNALATQRLGLDTKVITSNHDKYCDFGADLLFTGMPSMVAKLEPELPTILQLGGYDSSILYPGGNFREKVVKKMQENAEVITVIDPNYYQEMFDSDVDFNFGKFILAPNGYTEMGTQIKPHETKNFTVFNTAGDLSMKNPERFVEAARKCKYDDIMFGLSTRTAPSYSIPPKWLSIDNLKVFPKLPYNQVISLIRGSNIIAPFSEAEIFPWSVLESFAFGKATIVDKVGMVQTLPKEVLREAIDDFGKPVEHFDVKWEGEYFQGNHYERAETVDEFLEKVYYLYNNRDEMYALGRRGQSWVSEFWTQTEKMKLLLNQFTQAMKRG